MKDNIKAKKIVFIQTVPFELYGILSLAGAIKQHKVMVIITYIDSYDEIVRKLNSFKPDFLCFTACTSDHNSLLTLASKLKDRFNVPYIWGGPHPTFFPEIIENPGVDIVVRGEAEHILPKLIENPNDIKVSSCWFKTHENAIIKNNMGNLVQNLDDLPFPDFMLYRRFYKTLPYSSLTIVAGRGCPFNCAFCYNQVLRKLFSEDTAKGRYLRLKSPQRLINEIRHYIGQVGRRPRYIKFVDDTFIFNKKWLIEFLQIYKREIAIPFTCLGRADLINDELAHRLKEAGLFLFFWAIESGSERVRNDVCKKRISNNTILLCGHLLNKYKLSFRTYNMLALPTETLEEALSTVHINQKIRNKYPLSTIYDPYPGTELMDYIIANDLAKVSLSSDTYFSTQYEDSVIKCDPRILRLHKLFFYFVRFPQLNHFLIRWIEKDHSYINKCLFYAGYFYVFYRTYLYTIREMFLISMRVFKPLMRISR